jgi:hypothetical protein
VVSKSVGKPSCTYTGPFFGYTSLKLHVDFVKGRGRKAIAEDR